MANVGAGAAQGAGMGATIGSFVPGIGTAIGAGIGFLAGGLTSLFSGQSEADEINAKIRRAQAIAAEGLVDSGEISNRLNSIDRMFNQRLTSVLNTTAIRSRGYANQGTIGAAAAGGVEGDRLASKANAISMAQDTNRQVKQTIAQMELGMTEANPMADFVTGATSGVALGLETTKFIDNLNFNPTAPSGRNPLQGQTTPTPLNQVTTTNPYLPQGISPQMELPRVDVQSAISGVDEILKKITPPSGPTSNVTSSPQSFAPIGYQNQYEGLKIPMMQTYTSSLSQQGLQGFEWWRPSINPNHHKGWGY